VTVVRVAGRVRLRFRQPRAACGHAPVGRRRRLIAEVELALIRLPIVVVAAACDTFCRVTVVRAGELGHLLTRCAVPIVSIRGRPHGEAYLSLG